MGVPYWLAGVPAGRGTGWGGYQLAGVPYWRGYQRTRSVRSVDALIDVIGGRWRDVWREEKQCYYNLGYEDCKQGGQKRKFNAKADT